MITFRTAFVFTLAVLLSACGTTSPKSPVLKDTEFRSPPGETSRTIRKAGPETAMTLKVQPKDEETVPPLPPAIAEPGTPGTDAETEVSIGTASKSTAKGSSGPSKQPKLPSHMGKVQTGLVSPPSQAKPAEINFPDREKLKVKFTFDKADIAEVTNQIFGDFLKVNYVLDPTLQGRISFYLEGDFSREELFQMIFKAYEANNVSIVPRKGIYNIQPIQKSSNASLPIASTLVLQEKEGIRPVIVIYRLRYMDVKQAINTVKSFITPGRLVTSDALTNSIIFIEDSENAKSIVELMKALDVNVLQEVSMEIVPVQGMTPQDAAQGMENLVGKLDIFKQSAMKGNLAFIPLPSFGGVLILAQNPDVLKAARSWLQALDVHGQEAGEQIHVYFVQNGLATDIAEIVSQVLGLSTGGVGGPGQRVVESTTGGVLGRSSSFGRGFGSSTGSSGTFGSSFGRSGIGSMGAGSLSSQSGFGGSSTMGTSFGGTSTGGLAGSTSTGGRGGAIGGTAQRRTGAARGGPGGAQASGLTGEPIIIADEVNNAIVARANSTDWGKIKKTIETLDIVPRAVLIEVMVAEVALNKNMEYGLEWFFRDIGMDIAGKEGKFGAIHAQTGIGRNNNGTVISPINAFSTLGSGGLNMFWGSLDQKIGVLLKLLAEKTEVNVLSHPTLLATDNKEAAIHIGGREPVPTGSVTGGTLGGTTDVLSTIEYAETGLILNVIPHINAGGLVRLEVEQNIVRTDPAFVKVGNNTTAPRFTERNIKTTLLTQDGSTAIIGGIIQQNQNKDKTGVPFLQDAPIIWPLFSSKSNRFEKTEIVIAITPHVVNSRSTGATQEFIDALKRLKRQVENP